MPTYHGTRVLSITRNFVANLPVGVLKPEAATCSSTRVQRHPLCQHLRPDPALTKAYLQSIWLGLQLLTYRGQSDKRVHVHLKFAEVGAWPDSTSVRTSVLPSLPAMRYSPIRLGVAITTAELDQGTAE